MGNKPSKVKIMIDVAICDDNQNDIDLIREEIEKYSKSVHAEFRIREFSNPQMLVYEVEDGKIADIFILDVSMPQMNGFELADKIRKYSETAVIIFLTSMENQAVNGYKSKALRYIIKLNLKRDIKEALDSAIKELSSIDNKTVTLRRYNDYWRIPYKDIISVTRTSRKLTVATGSFGDITDGRGIKTFYELLNDSRFLFIDRGCFVNVDYISQISGFNVKLSDGRLLPVSRRLLQNVKQTLVERWAAEKD